MNWRWLRRDDCRTGGAIGKSREGGCASACYDAAQGRLWRTGQNQGRPGAVSRAVAEEKPLQVAGAINAYTARLAEAAGFRALYLSGGGVAANSLGMPDLGISTMEDVLTDVRRITDATPCRCWWISTQAGAERSTLRGPFASMIKAGAAAVHIEDQVGAKRCGHRPGKELVPTEEMVDRIKAAVDARTDEQFVIMARTDALAERGIGTRPSRGRRPMWRRART